VTAPDVELRLAGYFAKGVDPQPEWLAWVERLDIVGVCSVSDCINDTPHDWVDRWLHNSLGLFNEPEQARSVLTAADGPMQVFAYRVSTIRFVNGSPQPWTWPDDAHPVDVPSDYRSLGFDAVHKHMDSILGFECSPLSCNGLAKEWPVNRYCLLDDLEIALRAAVQFSIDQPEPGMYYVAEVFASSL
jgi:hypothetical protein